VEAFWPVWERSINFGSVEKSGKNTGKTSSRRGVSNLRMLYSYEWIAYIFVLCDAEDPDYFKAKDTAGEKGVYR